MQIDPRTVARDIPGIFDEIFPQLTPGIVGHFNTEATRFDITPLPVNLLAQSKLQRAMLFELGNAVCEQLLSGEIVNWTECFALALRRQRAYFDAKAPDEFASVDKELAMIVGLNISNVLTNLSREANLPVLIHPRIPGLEWISSAYGDFALGDTIIEVKCTAKRFSASDYRQVAIYWLLSYASAIEGKGQEWRHFTLLNPRRGEMVSMRCDAFVSAVSSGRTKVDILQLFQSLVGSRLTR